jgi:hypothetical protein
LLSQALPLVRQVVFNGTHLFWSQVPLQHSPLFAQVPSSDTQVEAEQAPPTQLSEQHSVELTHASSGCVHCTADELQVIDVASHTPEQQSPPERHSCPKAEQPEAEPPSRSEPLPPLAEVVPASFVDALPSPPP